MNGHQDGGGLPGSTSLSSVTELEIGNATARLKVETLHSS